MRMEWLRPRMKQYALRVIRACGALPKSTEAQVIGKQMLRSGTSSAANHREACRARSNAEFLSKLGVAEQELDETLLWFELLVESGIVAAARLDPLMKETDELLGIIVATIKSTRDGE